MSGHLRSLGKGSPLLGAAGGREGDFGFFVTFGLVVGAGSDVATATVGGGGAATTGVAGVGSIGGGGVVVVVIAVVAIGAAAAACGGFGALHTTNATAASATTSAAMAAASTSSGLVFGPLGPASFGALHAGFVPSGSEGGIHPSGGG